ncbi:MAG: hypothetical protein M1837_007479 [Sclerophora amabilis]|nr:MAG: hypothetical protein M1837_007479 [Sclerophora amabilis]
MKSNLELVAECDNFPCPISNPSAHSSLLNGNPRYYTLLDRPNGVKLGYIHPSVVPALLSFRAKHPDEASTIFSLDDTTTHTCQFLGSTPEARSDAVARLLRVWRENDEFAVLAGWRNELYPVYGPNHQRLFDIERAASALFGIVTYGVHMTAYVLDPASPAGSTGSGGRGGAGLKIWVPRRARTKQTYPSMLDNTVAGGLATGENAMECLVREAGEEASLPQDLVRRKAKAAGTVSYFHLRDRRAGGEHGLCQPECQYVYDLDLTAEHQSGDAKDGGNENGLTDADADAAKAGVVPRPSDDEVEQFYLWDVQEVQEALRKGEFKPNCALVLVDFFVRHGLVTKETEGGGFLEMVSRMHRTFEFPTA